MRDQQDRRAPLLAPATACGRPPRGPTPCRATRWARRPAPWPARRPARARSRRAAAGRRRAAPRACGCARRGRRPRASRRPCVAARRARSRPVTRRPSCDVLRARSAPEQVVLLEDEADAPAHVLEGRRARAAQLLARARAALPSCGERSAPTSVSSVVLPEPDGPVTMTISPAGIVGRDVVQDLPAQRALAVVVVEVLDDDRRVRAPSEHLRRVEPAHLAQRQEAGQRAHHERQHEHRRRRGRPSGAAAGGSRCAAERVQEHTPRPRRARSRARARIAACCSTMPDTKRLR